MKPAQNPQITHNRLKIKGGKRLKAARNSIRTPESKHRVLTALFLEGGIITSAVRRLEREGLRFDRGTISHFLDTDQDGQKFKAKLDTAEIFDEREFKKLSFAVAQEVQPFNSVTIELTQKLCEALVAEALASQKDRSLHLREAITSVTSAYQKINFIPQRYRDGLHPKAVPTIDQGVHQTTEIKAPGLIFAEFPKGSFDAVRELVDEAKKSGTGFGPAVNIKPGRGRFSP